MGISFVLPPTSGEHCSNGLSGIKALGSGKIADLKDSTETSSSTNRNTDIEIVNRPTVIDKEKPGRSARVRFQTCARAHWGPWALGHVAP